MHTNFTQQQLQDQTTARADQMLRRCVHCGLCTATCPTYVLLGDERDSPRGRIYLIKEMLETGKVTAPVTEHIDRCLSCLSCMTTCPSGVDYMHLVDLARDRIEIERHAGADRTTRSILARCCQARTLPPCAAARLAHAPLARLYFRGWPEDRRRSARACAGRASRIWKLRRRRCSARPDRR